MILTHINSQEFIFGGICLDENSRKLSYQLNFNGNNQEFTCQLSHLPDKLQNEFKNWVKKVNNYIQENIKIGQ